MMAPREENSGEAQSRHGGEQRGLPVTASKRAKPMEMDDYMRLQANPRPVDDRGQRRAVTKDGLTHRYAHADCADPAQTEPSTFPKRDMYKILEPSRIPGRFHEDTSGQDGTPLGVGDQAKRAAMVAKVAHSRR